MSTVSHICFFHSVMFCALLAGSSVPQALSAADEMVPLDVRQVRVGGEIGRRIDITVKNNLLVLDVEKDFLSAFRTKTADGGYIGLGKLIDAAVRFAAYTGDEKVLALKNRLVEETIKTQQSDGYIGVMATPSRMWKLWDIHEMSYIAFALISDYRFFGEKRSLEAAQKLTDYIIERWSTMPADWDRQTKLTPHLSLIGLDYTLLTLYRETNDRRYREFCTRQHALPEWDLNIVIGRHGSIEGHIYAYLARCLAQLELYRLQPDESLLRPTRRAIQFLTAQNGLTITGAVGHDECWTNDQKGDGNLGETCATAYQLRVYDSLLRRQGNPSYGDLIERTIYNALFAAQSPDGRQIRYYTPMEGKREYFSRDTYCCPGNYRRIIAELPTMVYYRSGRGLDINLYTPSEAKIDLDDGVSLSIRQETDYPTSGHIAIRLDPSRPTIFPLRLRIPRWCKKAAVIINGQPWQGPIAPGEFLTIERQWTAGDRVTLDLPMCWRLVLGRKRQSGRAAVMRGPVVFCLDPTQEESLHNLDAVDLGDIVIDPTSLKDSPGDETVRPGGMACAVRIGNKGFATGVSSDLSLRLTEFPDPDGTCVYFRLPDLSVAEPDELVNGCLWRDISKTTDENNDKAAHHGAHGSEAGGLDDD